jgi:hypothetical protein
MRRRIHAWHMRRRIHEREREREKTARRKCY